MCLAVPALVTEIAGETATVLLSGVTRRVSLVMTPEARVGDYVLIHTGYAINVLDQEEAQASLEAFAQLAEIQAEMESREA